ncbi:saccharopine dehydrogenase NADP-binding domain-containing protein [Candidatus Woesearchaeota archaeon]|nr:saccharopine dehydrogenase NADP-binding domain-containing protein [Candidatus Woesearchaeota archaeon]
MSKTIKDLFERGMLKLAMHPQQNDYLLRDDIRERIKNGDVSINEIDGSAAHLDLSKLDLLDGVVVTLIKKDYPAVSPRMWNTVYEKHNLKYRRIFAVAELDEKTIAAFLEAVKEDPKCIGGGAGSGFKDKIVPVLAKYGKLHPLTKIIGAANVIHKQNDGSLIGYNSDGEGFTEGLLYQLKKYNETPKGKKIVIFGAGGTTAAIAYTLVPHEPSEIVIINRTIEKAQDIADRINAHYQQKIIRATGEDAIPAELINTDAVVNASDKGGKGPLEMYSAFGKVSTDEKGHPIQHYFVLDTITSLRNMQQLPKHAIIADVNLTGHLPMTLQYAKAAGYTRLQDGLEMVARQAVLQFNQRHGNILPEDIIRATMFSSAGLTHE